MLTEYWRETEEAFATRSLWRSVALSVPPIEDVRHSSTFVVTGSGCSWPAAVLASRLLRLSRKDCRHLRSSAIKDLVTVVDAGIVFSTQFVHRDPRNACKSLRNKAKRTFVLTANSNIPSVSDPYCRGATVVRPSSGIISGGWVPVAPALMLVREFAEVFRPTISATVARYRPQRFATRIRIGEITSVLVVTTEDGEPAAENVATRLQESGVSVCSVCDLQNFRHGLFMPLVLGRTRTLVVLTGSARDTDDLHCVRRILPPSIECIELISPKTGASGVIDTFFSSFLLVSDILRRFGVDAANPSPPQWCAEIYETPLR